MRLTDTLKMAIHNMLRRPFRSILNLVGIVLGTSIILLTIAGSNGVKAALNSLLNGSELARKIIVHRGSSVKASMLDESQWKIDTPMSSDRRERLEDALKDFLLNELRQKDGQVEYLTSELLRKIEGFDNVDNAVPNVWFRFLVEHDGFETTSRAEGVSPSSREMSERMVVGSKLDVEDKDCILVHEFLAYRMGYRTDEELEELVGRKIDLTFRIDSRGNDLASILTGKWGFDGAEAMLEQREVLDALAAMLENLNLNGLTEQQKELIQSKFAPAMKPGVEAQVVKKSFEVKGVYRSKQDDIYSVFDTFILKTSEPIMFHYKTAIQLQAEVFDKDRFYNTTILVDDYSKVGQVESRIKDMGYKTMTLKSLLGNLEERIDGVGRFIYLIAFIILLVTSFVISNTLVMSVMERTSEFGIMKSLGAQNLSIVRLMFLEGALLGAIGAAIAVAMSYLFSWLAKDWLLSYLESRAGFQISDDIFAFSYLSFVLAFVGAILVCSVASVIPAWRAARLDPIVAMQRK